MRPDRRQRPEDILTPIFITKEFEDLDTQRLEKAVISLVLNNKCQETIFRELDAKDFTGILFTETKPVAYPKIFNMAKWCYLKYGSVWKSTVADHFFIAKESLDQEFGEKPGYEQKGEYYTALIKDKHKRKALVRSLISLVKKTLNADFPTEDLRKELVDTTENFLL